MITVTLTLTLEEALEIENTVRGCIASECGPADWDDTACVVSTWRAKKEKNRAYFRSREGGDGADAIIDDLDRLCGVLERITPLIEAAEVSEIFAEA